MLVPIASGTQPKPLESRITLPELANGEPRYIAGNGFEALEGFWMPRRPPIK
jgi:hypothetical protein